MVVHTYQVIGAVRHILLLTEQSQSAQDGFVITGAQESLDRYEDRKKLVPATRSISCITIADSSGGKARSRRKAVTNCAQTKNGSRIQLIHLARSWMIVAMKLTAPSSEDVINSTMPMIQNVCPFG